MLECCLDSIRSQLPADQLQLIVVDNACEQPLEQLAGVELVRLDDRVRVGVARNAGLERATGDFVVFVDADDVVLDGAFAFCLQRFAARPELVVCATSGLRVDESGTVVSTRKNRPWVRRDSLLAIECLWNFCCAMVDGTMIRTDAVRRAGGFGDSQIGSDTALSSRLLFYGPCEMHPRIGWHALYHSGSLWAGSKNEFEQEFLLELDRAKFDRIVIDPSVPSWVKWTVVPVVRWLAALRVKTSLGSIAD